VKHPARSWFVFARKRIAMFEMVPKPVKEKIATKFVNSRNSAKLAAIPRN
jgi:hypothetical protein